MKKNMFQIILLTIITALFCYSTALSATRTTPDKASFFAARRQALMERMGEGIAVFVPDGEDMDFHYLTGFDQMPAACPDSWLISVA